MRKVWAHQCSPWRRDWFELPLCCHYWNTYKKLQYNHQIKWGWTEHRKQL